MFVFLVGFTCLPQNNVLCCVYSVAAKFRTVAAKAFDDIIMLFCVIRMGDLFNVGFGQMERF